MDPSRAEEPPPQMRFSRPVSHALLLGAMFLIGWVLLPLWQPLLFALVIAAVLWPLQIWLSRKLHGRNYVAAVLTSFGVVLLILTPLTLLGIVAVRQAIDAVGWVRAAFSRGGIEELMRPLPDNVERWLHMAIERLPPGWKGLGSGRTTEAGWWAALQVQSAVTTISSFAFDLLMMLIALFFLLADGRALVDWVRRVSPLGRDRTQELLDEFRLVSRAVIGSNVVTGIAQALVATVGYYIAHVPQPLFFGLLTLLTSFIPSVGTALVSLPLAGLLLLLGHPGSALFLGAWALLLVGSVDNLLRPILIRGDLQVHGALIFFVVIGGIAVFGAAGLVVGPMALALFLAMLRYYARDLRSGNRPSGRAADR